LDKIADGLVWPLRDPQWVTKLLIIGLLLLIPIVGAINGLGWMLATLDRLRAGEERMAAANLSHLGRGLNLFIVQLGYGLGVVLITGLIYVPGLLLAITQGKENGNPGLLVLSIFLSFLAFGVATIGGLAVTFATPSFVLETDRGGIGGGLNLAAVYRRSRANLTYTLICGLMLIAANLVGSIGALVCFIGVVFTAAYGLAAQAWIFRSFEVATQPVPQSRSSS
jgi:hypothetical protein